MSGTDCGKWVTGIAQAGIVVMFATIVNLTNVSEIAITLFGIWHNKAQWCVKTHKFSTNPRADRTQGAFKTKSIYKRPSL